MKDSKELKDSIKMLDEGDYPQNLQFVCRVIINKRSFESFMWLDLV